MDIPKDIADRYTNEDQAERMDRAMRRILSISPERADTIRGESSVSESAKGRPPKGMTSASRVPVAFPHV
jgi:hypothetical protein